jgi:putative ABC transport system permease protein
VIGLRKAIGAERRDILVQFLLEASVLSLLSGSVGILSGYALSWLTP